MTKFEKWYFDTIEFILEEGDVRPDRTGTGTMGVFTVDYTHNLIKDGFPILSSRKFNYRNPIIEMIGFMRGITNSNWFNAQGCPFWNGFGLPGNEYMRKRKEDFVLADEYCSEKGKWKGNDPEYIERYRKLNSLPVEEGLKLITDHGISLYEDIQIGEVGDLGPIYGAMWRNWPGKNGFVFDQLKYAFEELRARPHNRRIVINGWNPSFMPDPSLKPHENVPNGNMSLTPCHVLHEYHTAPIPVNKRIGMINDYCHVRQMVDWEAYSNKNRSDEEIHDKLDEYGIPRYYLDLCWYQRSWDFILGAPANIAGYSAMLMMMAKLQGMIPRFVSVKAVHVHIYNNHLDGVKEMLRRRDDGEIPECKPELIVNQPKDVKFIDQFEVEDFELVGYEHLSHIKFPIAI